MDFSLRSAIILSVVIHASIFATFCNNQFLHMQTTHHGPVVVDYVVLKEIAESVKANKEVMLNRPEATDIAVRKQITERKEEAEQKKVEARETKKIEKVRAEDTTRTAAREIRAKESALKSNKDYVNYYQLVRDTIRARLINNYKYYKNEGDVYISFVLNSNGSLRSYEIDRSKSTSDEVLLHITVQSLKAVSPFPAIPKALSAPTLSFNLTISFKK